MASSDSIKGKVQTVVGVLNPSQLGKTMAHEHLSMSFDVAYVPPQKEEEADKTNLPFVMENLGWIRYNPYSHQSNLQLNGSVCEEAVLSELERYRALGGGSIVDVTTHGISRNTKFLRHVSQVTGVNIISGTGYYVAASQQAPMYSQSIESLSNLMRSEIVDGCADAPEVKCGVIGEIGCSWPLHDFEKRVLEAAALVQQDLKCPVSVHPGRDPDSPTQILRCFMEAGGDPSRVAMSHLDRTLVKEDHLLDFATLGSYLELDLFGNECSHYQLNQKISMPSDSQRIDFISRLITEGYEDKLLVSHDIHTKHRLMKYGGHGYSHILENIVPRMLAQNIAPEVVDKILITNPATWLTFQ